MAIFVPGAICRICGARMTRNDEIVAFPPFVPNKRDPLYFFSDGVFHRRCFDNHPLSKQAAAFGSLAEERGLPQNRICIVCGETISNPDDYFSTGYITSDRKSPAFAFNYFQFHRRHFEEWGQASEFRRAIDSLTNSMGWDGPRVAFTPLPAWCWGASR